MQLGALLVATLLSSAEAPTEYQSATAAMEELAAQVLGGSRKAYTLAVVVAPILDDDGNLAADLAPVYAEAFAALKRVPSLQLVPSRQVVETARRDFPPDKRTGPDWLIALGRSLNAKGVLYLPGRTKGDALLVTAQWLDIAGGKSVGVARLEGRKSEEHVHHDGDGHDHEHDDAAGMPSAEERLTASAADSPSGAAGSDLGVAEEAPATTPKRRSTTLMWVGIGTAGLGGMGLGLGAFAAALSGSNVETCTGVGPARTCRPATVAEKGNMSAWGIGLAVAGGILAAAGTVVAIIFGLPAEPEPEPGETTVDVMVGPGSFGMEVRW